jgi:hypothetical protein
MALSDCFILRGKYYNRLKLAEVGFMVPEKKTLVHMMLTKSSPHIVSYYNVWNSWLESSTNCCHVAKRRDSYHVVSYSLNGWGGRFLFAVENNGREFDCLGSVLFDRINAWWCHHFSPTTNYNIKPEDEPTNRWHFSAQISLFVSMFIRKHFLEVCNEVTQ